MKKQFWYFILILTTALGCAGYENRNEKITGDYTSIVIVSCEYLHKSNYPWVIIHKGNCKNPIHIKNNSQ